MGFLTVFLTLSVLAASSLAITNPSGFVLPATFADPRSVLYNGTYYAFATNNQAAKSPEPVRNVPVATSQQFSTGWSYSEADVLPNPGDWTAKANPSVWDPAVRSYSDSHFVMYYAARPNGTSKHCIGAAVATSITGQYTPQSTPLVCDNKAGGFISPNPFIYQGNPYIVYKSGASSSASIQVQQLSADGTALVGASTELIHEMGNEYDTEGPAMTFNPNNNGHPILLFVAGFFRDLDYRIEYAVAPTNSLIPPSGQQYKVNSTPLLQTTDANNTKVVQVIGPGGPCFPDLANNPQQMTFMADRKRSSIAGRSMRTANITYGSDNTLSIK